MGYLDSVDSVEMPAERTSYDLLPEGTYTAMVTKVDVTQGQDHDAIKVEFTIKDDAYANRKVWWSSKIGQQTSDKAKSFVKGQICKLAGTNSTNGDPLGVLAGAQGNWVKLDLVHKPGVKDPSKTFTEVYVREVVTPF